MRTGSPFKQAPGGMVFRPAFTAASWGSGAGFASGAAAIPANIGSASWVGTMAPAGASGTAMAGMQPFAAKGMSTAGTGGFLALAMMLGMSHMAKARAIMRKLQAARKKEYMARNEMKRYKNIYENLQVTNPYSGLRNPFENMGMSIDKRKAMFERDQFQQGQANMLSALQLGSGTGSSGVASKIKLLSQMGMEAAQKSAASIGQQEDKIRLLQPQMYAKIDQLERSGRNITAMFEKDKYAKLLGMSQMEYFAYGEEKYNQDQARAKNFQAIQQNFLSLAGSTAGSWKDMPGTASSTPTASSYSGGEL